ncbi:translation initiation factor IF-2 [uncultured Duncaniella sp.]|uniref:translation initiation factor IF-2 n=1 Tax=uncultured Duncaniella sp. TaxID=2768039 RepID=UPI0025FA67AE|nr:translation initiation factor IF-2 [uncultured Duncaniella sp.]
MPRIKISQAAKEFNVTIQSLADQLNKKGISIDASNPNTRLDESAYDILVEAFQPDRKERERIDRIRQEKEKEKSASAPVNTPASPASSAKGPSEIQGPKVVGKITLDKHNNPIPTPPAATKAAEASTKQPATPAPAKTSVKEDPKPEVSKPEVKVETSVKPEMPKTDAPKVEIPKAEMPKSEVNPQAPKVEAQKPAEVVKPAEAPVKETPVVKETPKKETTPEAPKTTPKTEVKPAPKPEAPKVQQKPAPAPAKETVKETPKAEAAPAKQEDEVFRYQSDAQVVAPKVVGHIDLSALNQSTRPKKKSKEERRNERMNKNGQNAGGNASQGGDRKKRRRIGGKVDIEKTVNQGSEGGNGNNGNNNNNKNGGNNHGGGNNNGRGGNERGERGGRNRERNKRPVHTEVNEEDVQKQVRETLARLTSKDKGQKKGAKWRKEKREAFANRAHEAAVEAAAESKVLKLTEFVTANDLAVMMDVPINNVIATCMNLGVMVSINQRLDAETINIVAEEFGYQTEYVSAEVVEAIHQEEDNEDELVTRPPIVTVMGHVDHGKTSLLDYIRNANVIAGEAGGITQHIGAYNVKLSDGRHITFLDTPGHEAFTAMRARGAKVTDLCIIIVAADDNVMPQTVEAINHASAAGVPIVFAINKIDKPAANPDKIKEELAQMNYLVEEWGGKYQSQDISAKKGIGVEELMEKVLLEAELLDLKANPNRRATGSIIESSLDKGRGYVATVLVQNGTLRVGDTILAGTHFGRVKAMFNERNQRITEAGPAEPTLILGLNGAPTAGDTFNVMETEQEAREIATKREQLQRELGLRTSKRTTLEEIGRRRAIGNFHELNIIVKGDVDGSIEALSDSLIKLSTEEVKINVLHKAVGAISESDVTLAAASDAIIIGFQVRPSQAARRAAERDGVEIRLYSVIYQAIEEVKDAMEGMLAPEIKEEVIGTAEVLQTFRISKVGTIAGAIVREGRIKRGCKVRLIRDGIVRYTGELGSLKRMKDDVKEVTSGYDCGLSIAGYNDVQEGDLIEAYEEVEVKKSL